MTKYWYTATTKDGKPVTLYVETYDAAIEHDLEQGPVSSLIHSVSIGGIPATEEQRHYALAVGAFCLHARTPGFAPVTKIYEAEAIPKGLEGIWGGGSPEDQTCAVVVYEHFV